MVAIKDFEIPVCCSDCDLYQFDYDASICVITKKQAEHLYNKRNDDCPLVEVKEGT